VTKPKVKEQTDLLSDVEPHVEIREGNIKKNTNPPPTTKRPPPPKSQSVARVEKLPPPAPQNMLAIIAAAAADPKVDTDKMRALLEMQKEIRAEEARMSFTRAFIALQNDLPVINATGRIEIEGKSGKKGQKTPYATFQEIHRVTKPILREHGFALWFAPDVGPEGRIVMRGYLDHVEGHGKTCAIPLPLETSGSKNNVQGVGSSISYGKRYATISLLNIVSHAPEDSDRDGADAPKNKRGGEPAQDDGDGAGKISMEQAQRLREKIDLVGLTSERFCAKYKIEGIADLDAAMFQEALNACDNFRKAAARG